MSAWVRRRHGTCTRVLNDCRRFWLANSSLRAKLSNTLLTVHHRTSTDWSNWSEAFHLALTVIGPLLKNCEPSQPPCGQVVGLHDSKLNTVAYRDEINRSSSVMVSFTLLNDMRR